MLDKVTFYHQYPYKGKCIQERSDFSTKINTHSRKTVMYISLSFAFIKSQGPYISMSTINKKRAVSKTF